MALVLGSLWRVLTPVTIVTILINVIPFVVHLRLGNWPGLFLTVLFIIYGVLFYANCIINRAMPASQILLLPNIYWFCSVYDIVLPVIKVATSGCCLRLLAHLVVILRKTESAQQTFTQHHYSTATILTSISGTLSTLLPSSSVIITTNRQRSWKERISNAINRISLWYKDYHERIWDVFFVWILPILYTISLIVFDERFSENDTYGLSSIRYLGYSPASGCFPNQYQGRLVSTIYYMYPLIIVGAGVCYTVLIGIKIFKLRPVFSSATSHGVNKPTLYRLFVFCCIYNILYLAHVPNAISSYMTVIAEKQYLWSEQDILDSKNGLVLVTFDKFEAIVLVVYPLLSFIWAIFFGTTQEAYDIYANVWRWIWKWRRNWLQQQEDHQDDAYMDPLLYQTTTASLPPSTSSLPSTVSTLVLPATSLTKKDHVKPPPPASLSSRSSSLYPVQHSRPIKRHTFSSILFLPDRPYISSRHSIHSSTGTVSSRITDASTATLLGHY